MPDASHVSPLSAELLQGEQMLWEGRPDTKRHLAPADVFLVPFTVAWSTGASFAVFDMFGLLPGSHHEGGRGVAEVAMASVFLVIALYLTVGRFFYKAWRKRRTFYGVTNRRVLSVQYAPRGRNVQAMFLDTIPAVNRRVRRDGSGTVTFGNLPFWVQGFANTGLEFFGLGWWGSSSFIAFYDIPRADDVVALVNRARTPGT